MLLMAVVLVDATLPKRSRVSTYGPSGAGRAALEKCKSGTPVRPGANVRPWWPNISLVVELLLLL